MALRTAIVASACLLLAGCGDGNAVRPLRVFHAAGLTPVVADVRDECLHDLGIDLLAEGSGSQAACRKLTELGRDCDVIMLADAGLVSELLAGRCSWRIDFARDEVVLGIGLRAPATELAEEDWPVALVRPDVRLGRVDENLGPIGYRTLLVWKLGEAQGLPGLYDRLLAKADPVVDHVSRLTPLLKTGEIDYGFLYRSSAIAWDIRYVELPDAINLGSGDIDYSSASVTFEKLKSGEPQSVVVHGGPITWALSIPDTGADDGLAERFVRHLLIERQEVFERNGFRPISPAVFRGPRARWARLAGSSVYGGELQ